MTIAAGRPRAPRRDAAQNREALLTAARELLNRDPDAPLEAVAAAAGLSRRAVYGHFATRDALIGELAERGAERIATVLAAVEHPDPVIEIALLGRATWDEVEHTRAMTAVALTEPFRSRIRPALGAIHDRVEAAVRRAAASGAGRTDLPPHRVARLIEGAAFTVLDEANRGGLAADEGRRLVVLAGLAALGLSWREAGAVVAAHGTILGLEADR